MSIDKLAAEARTRQFRLLVLDALAPAKPRVIVREVLPLAHIPAYLPPKGFLAYALLGQWQGRR